MNPNHLRELCWESKTSGELSGSIPGAQEAFLRTVFLTLTYLLSLGPMEFSSKFFLQRAEAKECGTSEAVP